MNTQNNDCLGTCKAHQILFKYFFSDNKYITPLFFVPTFRSFLQTVMSYFTWYINESTPTSVGSS